MYRLYYVVLRMTVSLLIANVLLSLTKVLLFWATMGDSIAKDMRRLYGDKTDIEILLSLLYFAEWGISNDIHFSIINLYPIIMNALFYIGFSIMFLRIEKELGDILEERRNSEIWMFTLEYIFR